MAIEPISVSSRVQAALDSVRGHLHELDQDNAQSFIDHGEAVVALELICDQLYEYGIAVPASAYNQIRLAGEAARIDPERWEILRVSRNDTLAEQ